MTTPSIALEKLFSLKRVLGKERQERWKRVENYFQEQFVPLYGSQTKLLEKVKQLDYRCRLLYSNSSPIGLLIYDKKAQKNKGTLSNCFEIKVLDTFVPEDHEDDSRSYLLQKAIAAAQKRRARYICIEVPHAAGHTLSFFSRHKFKEVAQSADLKQTLLGLKVEKTKRKREHEANSVPNMRPVKKRKKKASAHQDPSLKLMTSTIKNIYLEYIKKGEKTIEGRINDGRFAKLIVGQKIKFFCGKNNVTCDVKKVVKYPSFSEMLKKEDYKACLPDAPSLEGATDLYNSIADYRERSIKSGVIAIHLQVST